MSLKGIEMALLSLQLKQCVEPGSHAPPRTSDSVLSIGTAGVQGVPASH